MTLQFNLTSSVFYLAVVVLLQADPGAGSAFASLDEEKTAGCESPRVAPSKSCPEVKKNESKADALSKSDWSSIRAAHQAWKHSFQKAQGGYAARNPGQQWRTQVDERGFLSEPAGGGWKWGLELRSYGFGSRQDACGKSPILKANHQNLTRVWDEILQEWYVNDQRGLEHGFTLSQRPSGAVEGLPLVIEMAVRGTLLPLADVDGKAVRFVNKTGSAALCYDGLKVWDADGKIMHANMRLKDGVLQIEVFETDARYPLTIDPIAYPSYLKAGNNSEESDEKFGGSVAVSGDTVVIGAPNEDGSGVGVNPASDENAFEAGAAYVFVRSGTTWSQQAYLKASNTGAGDLFGFSVAVSGDTIVVGASEEDSSGTGVNSFNNNSSLNSGAAYIYVRSGTTWSQQAYLKAFNTGSDDRFGQSVAISGDTVVVGAYREDGSGMGVNPATNEGAFQSGAAYVYNRIGTTWSQQAYLKPSNTGSNDSFGYSVSISGDTIVAGAISEQGSGTGVNPPSNDSVYNAGAAYVFVRVSNIWSQEAYLKASNTSGGDYFGTSVAVSGDLVVVGAPWEAGSGIGVNPTSNDSDLYAGAAYVYSRTAGVWTHEAYLKAFRSGVDDFGQSVAVSGSTVVVGAWRENGNGTGVNPPENSSASDSGAAYVYVKSGGSWNQQAYLKASNTGSGDEFGRAVAISGDTIVVGAIDEDGTGTGVNPVDDNAATNTGASYLFVRSSGTWSHQVHLKASNTDNSYGRGDLFGSSVAAAGETVVIGAPGEDGSGTGFNPSSNETAQGAGAVYVFVRIGGVWSQQAYLKASNTGGGDGFGNAVAISGDTILVGATGEDGGGTGVNPASNESVSGAGAAYVFTRTGTTWSQQAYLKASNTGLNDGFGRSVSVSGNTLVVGSSLEDGSGNGVNAASNEAATDAGAAYVFVRNGTSWTHQAYLKASNTGAGDSFGISVAISGDLVVVGASGEDGNGTIINPPDNNSANGAGAAYLFQRTGTVWMHSALLKPLNTGASDGFGASVAAAGGLIAVGSPYEDSSGKGINPADDDLASAAGAVYIFGQAGGVWTQQAYLKSFNTDTGDVFGTSVSAWGGMVVVGAPGEDGAGTGVNAGDGSDNNAYGGGMGAVYEFIRNGETWSQRSYLKPSNTAYVSSIMLGSSVAVSSTAIIGGAPFEDKGLAGVNSPLSNYTATDSGAAYLYLISDPDVAVEQPVGNDLVSGSSTISFGDVLPGGSVLKTFNFRNAGNATMTISGVAKGGANWTDFTVSQAGMLYSLAPGASTSFSVTFSPSVLGQRSAFLNLITDDPDEAPFIINVSGTGVAPEIVVTGNGVSITDGDTIPSLSDHTDFDGVLAVSGTITREFIILNSGTASLSVGSLSLTGAASANFTLMSGPETAIAPGGSTAFQLSFDPSAKGLRTAVLSFSTNDADEGVFNFNIQGTGLNTPPSDISLSPSSLAENNALGATVGTFSTVDADPGESFSYSLVTGAGDADNGSFSFSGSTLRINATANYEAKNSYDIRVRVSDGAAMFEKSFTIAITNVNEAPTFISLSPSSLQENNIPDTVVGTLSVTDQDVGDTHSLQLVTGTGSTDNGSFTISGNNLSIGVSANYEGKASYSVRIRATDSQGSSYERALAITITNANEAPTNITLSAASLAENSGPFAVVGTLTTSDADTGDTRAYSINVDSSPTDGASFTISGSTLRLAPNADYESQDTYTVRIRVTDSGGLFFEKLFTISVLNKNELPSFTKGPDLTHPIRAMGAQIIPGWATAVSDGDSTMVQVLSFNTSVINGSSIFSSQPAVAADGTLSYSTNGAAGAALVSVTLTDDASINANPALTTTTQTFTIRVEGPSGLDSLDANIVGDRVLAMAMQPDGKMLLGGSFTTVLGVPRANIARLNVDGTLDMGFDPKTDGVVYAVAVQPDGKVLVGGSFGTLQPNGAVSATARQHLARVHADGTLDAAFDPKADSHVRSILPQPDGKVLVVGDFTSMKPNGATSATPRAHVARLLSDGSLDVGFTPNANDVVYAMALQYDQKILLGGDFTTLQGTGAASFTNRRYVARLNADGTLDASFDPKANGTVFALAEQSDGKLLMGGAFTTLQPNGAPSSVTRNYIARVNATGTLDTGFNPSANGSVFSLARQANGRLLLGGAFTGLQPNGAAVATVRNYLARLNSDGTLDASFDPNANGLVYGIALQDDGRVLVGGELTTLQPNAAPVASARTLFARLVNDTASRVLAAPDFTQVTWTHGGAAPVVNGVTFDLSTNGGSSWAQIGVGTRISSTVNWQLAGLSLPSSGMLRARGRAVSGIYNGSSSLFEQVESFVVAVPDIVLEEPVGTELLNGTGMANFGPVAFDGSSSEKQFTIRNAGNAPLSLAGVTLSGAQAGSFVVNTTGMASVLDPMSATTFTVTFTPGELGSQGASLLVASNDQDEPGYGVTLAGTGVTSLQGWRQLHFGTTSGSGNAADNADPDGDGLGNFIEWACALNPTTNSTLPTPVVLSGAEIDYFYMRSVAAVNAGTVFEVQWSDSLPGTAWSTTNVTQTILSTNGTTQQVKATLPAGSSEQRFVRLRVTSGP